MSEIDSDVCHYTLLEYQLVSILCPLAWIMSPFRHGMPPMRGLGTCLYGIFSMFLSAVRTSSLAQLGGLLALVLPPGGLQEAANNISYD